MLLFGVIPIGLFPFSVKGVNIHNNWVRMAGLAIILGYGIIAFASKELHLFGLIILAASLPLIIIAIIVHISSGY